MKLRNKLIIKFITLGLAFIILIKWLGVEKQTYLSTDQVCPNFGNLTTLQIPKASVSIDPFNTIKRIGIKNKLGEKKFYPLEYLDGALLLKHKSRFKEYMTIYSDICGGRPEFYNSIEFVRLERLKKIESKRQELAKLKSDTKEWGKFYAKEKQLRLDISFLENRINSLKAKLTKATPISYKIIGKVAEEEKGSLIVFGSAIPDVSGKQSTAGFVHNGIIILKNSRKADVVSPEYYEAKHVLAKDYYFVKRIDGRDNFGHYMPVSVYDRNVKATSPKLLSELKKEILVYQKKLLSSQQKLKDMERIEEHLIATVM